MPGNGYATALGGTAGRTASPRRPWRHLMPDIHEDEPKARKPDRLVFGDGEGSGRRPHAGRRQPGCRPAVRRATRHVHRACGRIVAHVFHRYGRPIKSLRRAWMRACRDAGRPGLLLHDLRRSAVRNLERAGVSCSVAMKLTGHKTEAVYRRDAIVAESDLRDAGTKLAAMLGTTPESGSPSDNSGDKSVTARKTGRSSS